MKRILPKAFSLVVAAALALSLFAFPNVQAGAVSSSLVISQVYGGGGNTGATYKNDFIELYNRGASTVDITNWSVQYASSGGSSWSVTKLCASAPCTLAPGKYFLIQEAAGTGGTLGLAADVIGSLLMSATAGKVALVSSVGALSGSCPLASTVDFVGFGTTTCFEGSGPTGAPSNTNAVLRKGSGATDTDNNSADFTVGAPNPRNSALPNPSGVASTGSNATLLPGDAVLLLVQVVPGESPSSGFAVSCDLSPIGGAAAQSLYDDGTHGDVIAGNGIFSFSTTIVSVSGASIPCAISDSQGRSGTSTILLNILQAIGVINGPIADTDVAPLHSSPFVGRLVSVQGVIYERTLQAASNPLNPYKGFFIQNTAATADGDANTSDGLYVYMKTDGTIPGPSGTTYTPTVGDEVIVSGTISEYFNMTQLGSPILSEPVLRSGVDLEAEVAPFIADPPSSMPDAARYWERLQAMRGRVPANSIVLNGRNVFNPADAEVWVARDDSTIALRGDPYTRRAFRDAHPLDDNYDPGAWDGNGYRMLMGSWGIKWTAGDGQALIAPARTFDTVTNAPVGGVNYSFGKYRLEVTQQPELSEGPDPAANNPPQTFDRSLDYSIVDYNLENLYDYRNNPFSGCDFASDTVCPLVAPFLAAVKSPFDYVPASSGAYQARLSDIAAQIVSDLHAPDILMVQEVENQDICSVSGGAAVCGLVDNADGKPDALQDLALQIAAIGGPAYDAAFDRNSSDLRGIAPAFMYRTDRVEMLSPVGDPVLGGSPAIDGYTAVPYDSDISNPKTLNALLPAGVAACETSWVFPRAPGIGLFRIYSESVGTGNFGDVYIINNHFKSGPDSCVAHRTEQARYNAALVEFIQTANPAARLVVGGDLNVYPRPDDPFAPMGQPRSSDQLGSLYATTLGLKNLWEVLLEAAPESAYSYVYQGMAQTLDQVFVNQPLLADLEDYRTAHINSDFAADYPDDVARGTSDHDPNVATFAINLAPTADAGGPYSVSEGGSVMLTAGGSDPESGPLTYAWDLDNDGTFETTGKSVVFSAASLLAPDQFTVTVQVTDNGGATATDQTTVQVTYNLQGFFKPTKNAPYLNAANAGQGIPVKFGLGSDKGLAVLASGFPVSQQISCDTLEPLGEAVPTDDAGASDLSYDPLTNTYVYIWKTASDWTGTCRQFTLGLNDGTFYQVLFQFSR